jgi:hypothetical protein
VLSPVLRLGLAYYARGAGLRRATVRPGGFRRLRPDAQLPSGGIFGRGPGRGLTVCADPGRVGAKWAGVLARSTGVHRRLFIDLGPVLQYSKVLARCCAWGLGVLTRTV